MAVIRPTVLNINKPIGWTSRDVLNKLQSIYNYSKFGHAGTLDPLATGVLIVLVGDECKKQDYYMGQDKTYETRIVFGISSPTNDLEGPIITGAELKISNEQLIIKIKKYLNDQIGEFEQAVPYFSAVKINGKEMYKSARNQELIDNLPVKKVCLNKFTIFTAKVDYAALRKSRFSNKPKNLVHIPESFTKPLELRSNTIEKDYKSRLKYYSKNFPFIDLVLDVSKGFYVRSLARDLGEILGTSAVMASLTRTRVGTIKIANSKTLKDFESAPDLV